MRIFWRKYFDLNKTNRKSIWHCTLFALWAWAQIHLLVMHCISIYVSMFVCLLNSAKFQNQHHRNSIHEIHLKCNFPHRSRCNGITQWRQIRHSQMTTQIQHRQCTLLTNSIKLVHTWRERESEGEWQCIFANYFDYLVFVKRFQYHQFS